MMTQDDTRQTSKREVSAEKKRTEQLGQAREKKAEHLPHQPQKKKSPDIDESDRIAESLVFRDVGVSAVTVSENDHTDTSR